MILEKTPTERFKTVVKNSLATLRIDVRGWRSITQWDQRADTPRLDSEQLQRITKYSANALSTYAESLRDADIEETCEWQSTPMVESLLSGALIHKRIVNIGCAYVKAEKALCEKYPEVTWDMLDFAPDLAQVNEDVAAPNMNFVSCYPLEFLETTDHKYDIALFNRTLTVIVNAEVRNYFLELVKRCRYIVFCEVGSVLRFIRSIDVDKIPAKHSLPARGIMFIHNYRAILEDCGFELRQYDAHRTPVPWHGEQHYLIKGIAENKKPSLV